MLEHARGFMALKLYPRHRKERESGHPEDARTGQFEGGATRLLLQKVISPPCGYGRPAHKV